MAVILPRIFADALVAGENAVASANTEVVTNATITTTRRGAHPLTDERVEIKEPKMAAAVNAAGQIITTEIALRQDANIQKNDTITVTQMDAFDALTKQEGYTVSYVARFNGQIHAYVEGTIQ